MDTEQDDTILIYIYIYYIINEFISLFVVTGSQLFYSICAYIDDKNVFISVE